jgi:hypothetical protein
VWLPWQSFEDSCRALEKSLNGLGLRIAEDGEGQSTD